MEKIITLLSYLFQCKHKYEMETIKTDIGSIIINKCKRCGTIERVI